LKPSRGVEEISETTSKEKRVIVVQSDPILVEKFVRGTFKGLSYVKQNRSGTIPVLANLMKI
jgi:hypothetical protein